jgi:hypothetical protein
MVEGVVDQIEVEIKDSLSTPENVDLLQQIKLPLSMVMGSLMEQIDHMHILLTTILLVAKCNKKASPIN